MTEKKDKQIVLTPSQQQAFNKLKDFVNGSSANTFILTGYAGTGKTTLMKTLIEWINEQNKEFQLLASTGRAAKILSNKTECETKTVHSCIYTFADFNQDIEKVVNQIDDSKVLTIQDSYYCNLHQPQQRILIMSAKSISLTRHQ